MFVPRCSSHLVVCYPCATVLIFFSYFFLVYIKITLSIRRPLPMLSLLLPVNNNPVFHRTVVPTVAARSRTAPASRPAVFWRSSSGVIACRFRGVLHVCVGSCGSTRGRRRHRCWRRCMLQVPNIQAPVLTQVKNKNKKRY